MPSHPLRKYFPFMWGSSVDSADIAPNTVVAADIAAGAVANSEMNAEIIKYVDIQLTNAQMLALRATPVAVLSAPGANRANIVNSIVVVCDSAGGAYTETIDNIVLEYAGGTDILTIETTGFITTGNVQVRAMGAPEAVLTPEANAGLQLINSGDGEFGGGNAANSLSIRIYYHTVDTVAFT